MTQQRPMPDMRINNQDFLSRILEEWKKFMAGGEVDERVVRKQVLAAWQRSRDKMVDPYQGDGRTVLRGKKLSSVLESNAALIEVARPFLHELYQLLEGYAFFVFITDASGVILEMLGDDHVLSVAENMSFVRGAIWDEINVGATTISEILHSREAMQMTGAEHYCVGSHRWTCSGAPLLDENGDLLGVINVTGASGLVHKHTFGMVSAAAQSIHYLLRMRKQNKALLQMNTLLNKVFEAVAEPLIVLDGGLRVENFNAAASRLLGRSLRAGDDFFRTAPSKQATKKQLASSGYLFSEMEISLNDGSGTDLDCFVSSHALDASSGPKGRLVSIHPIERVHKLVGRFSASQARLGFDNVITNNVHMKDLVAQAQKAAKGEGVVVLEGESGTGKEIFAQAIHTCSRRKNGPFVALNCGAIPHELIASELFGYVAGAFTNALKAGRPGKFELAGGGTLFLDEIGDMPLQQQVALLRVIQERRIIRVGGDREIPVDARIICATNKPLKELTRAGKFREDLYYRLNVVKIRIPPLRQRKEDIPLLFRHFLNRHADRAGLQRRDIPEDILDKLLGYHWPGNVRELHNIVERIVNMHGNAPLTASMLPEELRNGTPPSSSAGVPAGGPVLLESLDAIRKAQTLTIAAAEKQAVIDALKACAGNVSLAARQLNQSRNTFYRRLKKFGLR